MLNKENKYDFRKRMLCVHQKNLRDSLVLCNEDEFEIKDGMRVIIDEDASVVTETAAKDFVDFLYTSMGVSVMLKKGKSSDGDVFVTTVDKTPMDLKNADSYKGFCIDVKNSVTVCGHDDRGAAQGLYYLEKQMSAKRGPYIKKETVFKKPLFYPRMVHSGYGLDHFPDEHLSAIAHAGRDAILIFVKGLNTTPYGYLDFNELIYRAAKYGIDVYAYSYLDLKVHPEEEGAEKIYDGVFGRLFKECPGLRGLILVGESAYFESRDPHIMKDSEMNEYAFKNKPSAGYYPCEDYPAWIELVKKSVRKNNPDADVVFWTYNSGWGNEKERIEFIKKMPKDVSLLVTYEMYEQYPLGDVTEYCADYTLSFAGPGKYFISEAKAAKENGIKLYAMTNTGGLTWDMGTIPYEPMPHQWKKRYDGMIKAHEEWGLCGLMESHHYGFYPSFIGDISCDYLYDVHPCFDEVLKDALFARYGKENTDVMDAALKLWSEAICHFVPSEDEQYGPFRVGPVYPFCLKRISQIPSEPYAMFGSRICFTDYGKRFPQNYVSQNTFPTMRIKEEIKSLLKAKELMKQGIELLKTIPNKNDELLRLINMGEYIVCIITTGVNVKEWYFAKTKLFAEEDRERANKFLDELERIAVAEMENVCNTIEFVQKDSRLGWEPSMEYVGHQKNLEWKINQLKYVTQTELKEYRYRFSI